jgi:hypothetical protein
MKKIKKDFKKISFGLITVFLLSTLTIVSINWFKTEHSEHGTLILKGADSPTDATKSNYVYKFLRWLVQFTGKLLDVGKDGKVTVVSTPPQENHLAKKLDNIINDKVTVQINLDSTRPDILIDRFEGFGHGTVDIDDLDSLPDPNPNNPDEVDKAEAIAHILGEYYYSAKNNFGPDKYLKCHVNGGLANEYQVRKESNGAGARLKDKKVDENKTHIVSSHHWYGPPDQQGNRQEVYREVIVQDKTKQGKITDIKRTPNPPNPIPLKDPVSGEVLVFIGRIVEVGSPEFPFWSGIIENLQSVTYEILQIIQGNYTEANILIYHAIVHGSPDADPEIPKLTSSIFYPGNVVMVKAVFSGVAWEADTSVVGGFGTTATVTSTTTVITSTTITNPVTFTTTITSPTTIISTTPITFTTTITFTTPSIDMSSLFPYIVLVLVLAIVAVGAAIYFMRVKRKA